MTTRNRPVRPVTQKDLETIRSKRMIDLELSPEILAVCASEQVETVGDLYDLSAESLVATNFSCEQVTLLRKLLIAFGLKRRSPAELSPDQQVELNKRIGSERRWLSENVLPGKRNYAEENRRYLGYLLSRNPVDRMLARHMLVAVNEPGVRKTAYRYASFITSSYGIDLEDLLAEGNLGVLRAAEEFDPRMGNEFYTYAVWWIRHYISRYVLDSGIIRVPANLQQRVQKYNRVLKTLPAEIPPTELSAIMCRELKLVPKKFQEFLKTRENLKLLIPDRLDGMTDGDGGVHDMYEHAQAGSAFELDDAFSSDRLRQDVAVTLEEVSESLSVKPRDKLIMRMLYGLDGQDPMTLQAVGDIFGISRERVRQIEQSMLERMKNPRLWVGKEDQLVAVLGLR